jgi:hypothetical protein
LPGELGTPTSWSMNEPARPSPEPEIIPPGAPLPQRAGVWMLAGTQHVYTARLGPVGLGLVGLALGVGVTLGLVLLVGLLAISLVSVGFLAIGFVIAGILRKANQPLR